MEILTNLVTLASLHSFSDAMLNNHIPQFSVELIIKLDVNFTPSITFL